MTPCLKGWQALIEKSVFTVGAHLFGVSLEPSLSPRLYIPPPAFQRALGT
jgi:hypothetical protein